MQANKTMFFSADVIDVHVFGLLPIGIVDHVFVSEIHECESIQSQTTAHDESDSILATFLVQCCDVSLVVFVDDHDTMKGVFSFLTSKLHVIDTFVVCDSYSALWLELLKGFQ